MNDNPDVSSRKDGIATRVLLALMALGTSLMLLGSALVPSAEGDESSALELVSASLDRLIGLIGG